METFDFEYMVSSRILANTPCIITIGVFDGVHKAHQKIFQRALAYKEKREGVKLLAITFSRNPKPGPERNIDTLRIRSELMADMGVDFLAVIDFSDNFSNYSSDRFIEMLAVLCNPVAIVVGDDFRFGNPKASASAKDLESMFLKHGRSVEVMIEQAILTEGGERISSTLVRRVIDNGQVECISNLTGRNYRVDLMPVTYQIEHGALVFCRKSIHQLLPPPGVYETDLTFLDNPILRCLCVIDEENLRLEPSDTVGLTGRDLGKDGMQKDSIYFLEKRK